MSSKIYEDETGIRIEISTKALAVIHPDQVELFEKYLREFLLSISANSCYVSKMGEGLSLSILFPGEGS